MKEKTVTELRDEKKQLSTRAEEILSTIRTESRMMNEAESKEMGEIQARKIEIDLEIDKQNELKQKKPMQRMGEKVEKFSLRRAIVAQMRGTSQSESDQKVINDASELNKRSGIVSESGALIVPMSYRAALSTTNSGVLVDEDKMEMLFPLENSLVLAQAGARYMTGLTGNIVWPNTTSASVFWEGENDEAQDGSNVFSKGTVYAPKRLTAYVDISKQLLIQENVDVEGIVRQLITNAISQKLEATAFSADAATETTPGGLFADGATTGTFDWATIVGMETKVDTANALFGNLGYIMNPALIGKAKTKVKDTSGAGGFIFGNDGQGYMNGYKALRTNNIGGDAESGYNIAFGNWNDFFIGQWGSVEILVDQYTQATKGMIRLVVNSYWNMGAIRKESFALAALK